MATGSGDWSVVETIAPRQKVVVERRADATLSGTVRATTADSIEVDTDGTTTAVSRPDVRRVLRVRSRASKNALRGLAIGGVGGVLQGLLLTKSNRGLFAGLFGAGWAIIGGAAGAISGAKSSDTEIIYAAPDTSPLPDLRMQPTRRVLPDGARLIRRR